MAKLMNASGVYGALGHLHYGMTLDVYNQELGRGEASCACSGDGPGMPFRS